MMREKVVTIIIGLVVGAMLAAAYFFGPQLVAQSKNQLPSQTPTPEVSKTPTPTKKTLTISSPEDNSSTTQSPIKITGVATPNAKIVIYSNADQKLATASSNGKFESTVKLEEGENEVSVTDLTEPIQTKTINVTLEVSK